MQKENSNLKYRLLWLLVGYSLVAFVVFSSLTSIPVTIKVDNFDKYAHTLGYFVLMGWFVQIYHARRHVLVCALIFLSMGTGLEFVQGMTTYRYFDVYDMLANTLGVFIAWGMTLTKFPYLLKTFEKFIISEK